MDFAEAKMKKERGMSVKDVLEERLEVATDIETIVIVSKRKDGIIETTFSWENSTEAVGMLTIGQDQIVEYLRV